MENNPQGYIVRPCLVAATEGVRGRFACLFVLNKLNQNKKMKNQKQNKKTQTVNLPWKRASVTVSQRSLESWVIACTAASVTCGTARLLLFATTYLAECTAGGKQDCGSRTWRDCVATKIADQADGGMHVLLKEKKKNHRQQSILSVHLFSINAYPALWGARGDWEPISAVLGGRVWRTTDKSMQWGSQETIPQEDSQSPAHLTYICFRCRGGGGGKWSTGRRKCRREATGMTCSWRCCLLLYYWVHIVGDVL